MGSGTMFGEHTIHFLQSNLMHRPIETVNEQMLESVKTAAEQQASRHSMVSMRVVHTI